MNHKAILSLLSFCGLMLVCSYGSYAQAQDALGKFHLTTPTTSSALNISKDESNLEIIVAPVETNGPSYFLALSIPSSSLDLLTLEPAENKKRNFRGVALYRYESASQPNDLNSDKQLKHLCSQLDLGEECTQENLESSLSSDVTVKDLIKKCVMGKDGVRIEKSASMLHNVEIYNDSKGPPVLDGNTASMYTAYANKASKMTLEEASLYSDQLLKSGKKEDAIAALAIKSALSNQDKCKDSINTFLLLIGGEGRAKKGVKSLAEIGHLKLFNALAVPHYTSSARRLMLGASLTANRTSLYKLDSVDNINTLSQKPVKLSEYSPGLIVDWSFISNNEISWSVHRVRFSANYQHRIKSTSSELCELIKPDASQSAQYKDVELCEKISILRSEADSFSGSINYSFLYISELVQVVDKDSNRKLAFEVRPGFSYERTLKQDENKNDILSLSTWIGVYLMPQYGDWGGLVGLSLEPIIDTINAKELRLEYQAFIGVSF